MYASLNDLKRYLNIDLSFVDDGLLQRCLDAGKETIDSYTHRRFAIDCDETMWFRLSEIEDGRFLHWYDMDLAKFTGVSLSHCQTQCPTTTYTVPPRRAPFYGIEFCNPVYHNPCYCGHCTDMIGVIGRWAYSVTAPADIVQANVRLSAWYYRQKDSHVDIQSVTSSANGTVIIPSGLPKDVKGLLQPYKRVAM